MTSTRGAAALFGILAPLCFCFAASDPFPVPELIRNNVVFWKKIYSEVSLQEGLLHDREHPLIIYEKVKVGTRTGTERTNHIDSRRAIYRDMITAIRSKTDADLTAAERTVKTLFETHGSPGALEGAEERIRFQTGQRERFRAGLERSYAYLDTIITILKAHGVPERLKYLPHVESSFDPDAYSKVGAAGMWQFMRSTGKLFMRVDYNIDERLDPIRSTVAAARLLRQNYNALQSWALAITAYNHGLGGMRRAVASTGSNDIAVILEKHESPSFKFASKNFYACFIAAAYLADSADVYFPDLNKAKPFRATTVAVPSVMKPATLIRQLGVSEEEFRRLNPSFRPVVFQQQRLIPEGFVINLPAEVSPTIAKASLNKTPRPKQETTEDTEYYTVVRGDNLSGIARRFGISVQELSQLNTITHPHRIHEGQVLRLPGTSRDTVTVVAMAETEPAPALDPSVDSEHQESVKKPATKPPKPPKASPSPSTPEVRRVEVAESVTVVTTVATAGSARETRAAERGPEHQFDAGVYDLGIEVAPGGSSAVIRVAVDETIGRYADWMGVSVASIKRINDMKGNSVRIGQKLQIPVGPKSDLKKFEVSRLEYHMGVEEDFYSRYDVTDVATQTVRSGETVWGLSSREQIPLWLIKKHNRDQDVFALKPGSKIRIPRISEKSIHTPPALTDSNDPMPILPTVESPGGDSDNRE